MINFVSNISNFIVKEAHEVITMEGYRNAWLTKTMTLLLATVLKRNLRLFLFSSINK